MCGIALSGLSSQQNGFSEEIDSGRIIITFTIQKGMTNDQPRSMPLAMHAVDMARVVTYMDN